MAKGGRGNIIKALEELDKNDIYSLILFTLYKLKENPEYSTLSELVYVLDNENFIKFINYYGGQTIKVPTINELNSILNSLLVFEELNNTDKTIDNIFSDLNISAKDKRNILKNVKLIQEVLNNYEFKR